MYFLEKNFKNRVIGHVKNEEMSISRLARELERDGYKMHRLYLTGYLRAMADLGILKEKEIPPSKVYTTSANMEKTIYESIGDKCKSMKLSEIEEVRVATSILQRLFKRPIFLSEVKECGLDGAVVGSMAPQEERSDIRHRLLKAGLKIPNNDPAYIIEEAYNNEFSTIISSILIDKFDAQTLIVETKQTKLDELSPAAKSKKRKSSRKGSRKRSYK